VMEQFVEQLAVVANADKTGESSVL